MFANFQRFLVGLDLAPAAERPFIPVVLPGYIR
jgi:hypothetical protein